MADQNPTSTGRSPKQRIARRVLEIITAAAFLVAVLYWPTTNTGRVYLVMAAVVFFVGLKVLFKWPSV
jgi:hypothetical protein